MSPSPMPASSLKELDEKSFSEGSSSQPADMELGNGTRSISESEVENPDGKWAAWLTLVGGWLIYFSTFGYNQSFGVYQDFYTRAGTSSPSNVSWIGSVQLFFIMISSLPSGKLLDAGRFRVVSLTASVLFLFSNFMLSLADYSKYYQLLLAQGFGIGIGSGLLSTSMLAIQAHHWRKHRAAAMIAVSSSGAVSGAVLPIMLNRLINGKVGFVWGVRITSFLFLVLVAAGNMMIRPGKNVKKTATGAPPKFSEVLKDGPYMITSVGVSITTVGILFPMFYIQLFAISRGIDESFAFYLLTIMNGASMFGRLLAAVLSTRIGVLNLIVFCDAITGAIILAMLGIHNSAGVVVFTIIYGCFSGSVIGLLAPAFSSFARQPSEVGLRVGLGYSILAFGVLAGMPIVGALLSGPIADYPWYRPIIFTTIACLIGVALMTIGRFMQAARVGTWRV